MSNVLPFNRILSSVSPWYCSITITVTDRKLFIWVEECLSVALVSNSWSRIHHLPSVGSSCPLMTDLRHCVEASPHPHNWGNAPSCPAVGNKSFSPDFLWDKLKEGNRDKWEMLKWKWNNRQDQTVVCFPPCASQIAPHILWSGDEASLKSIYFLAQTSDRIEEQQSINATFVDEGLSNNLKAEM